MCTEDVNFPSFSPHKKKSFVCRLVCAFYVVCVHFIMKYPFPFTKEIMFNMHGETFFYSLFIFFITLTTPMLGPHCEK